MLVANDEGTVAFYRQRDEPRHLVLFEQWRDADALNVHIARLQRVFGPPDEQEPHPATFFLSGLEQSLTSYAGTACARSPWEAVQRAAAKALDNLASDRPPSGDWTEADDSPA